MLTLFAETTGEASYGGGRGEEGDGGKRGEPGGKEPTKSEILQ